jgi:hypothetical protein
MKRSIAEHLEFECDNPKLSEFVKNYVDRRDLSMRALALQFPGAMKRLKKLKLAMAAR